MSEQEIINKDTEIYFGVDFNFPNYKEPDGYYDYMLSEHPLPNLNSKLQELSVKQDYNRIYMGDNSVRTMHDRPYKNRRGAFRTF